MIIRFFLLFIFYSLLSFSQELSPKLISKNGDVEVPNGMHIVKSRSGERWLLPLEMTVAPIISREADYFEFKKEKWSTDNQDQAMGEFKRSAYPISGRDAIQYNEPNFISKLPQGIQDLLEYEKKLNLHGRNSPTFDVLGDFSPKSEIPFLLPFIPLEKDEFEYLFQSYSDFKDMKWIKFTSEGKEYYKFFIHPNYVDRYQELIEKHGIVYHYYAVTTSSPRSLIVVDPKALDDVYWVKPSLHKKIDGSVRTNTSKKVVRSSLISNAFKAIPEEDLEKMGVEVMYEPFSMLPRGRESGTIFRKIHPDFKAKKELNWLPALSLNSSREGKVKTVLLEMIEKSKKTPINFVTEKIIRPILRAYLSLSFLEGLSGELHVQNFYYQLGEDGLPTGKILIKDLDGFRYDVEIAMRNNRDLSFLAKYKKPFIWAKFSNSLGTGGEKIPFVGSWYYKLIRNVTGFETLSSYILNSSNQFQDTIDWDKDFIQRLFDDIAIEESTKITGLIIPDELRYGFNKDKGLNWFLHEHRASKSRAQKFLDVGYTQEQLKEIYMDMKLKNNVHERRGLNLKAKFRLVESGGHFFVEAYDEGKRNKYKNPTIGLAILDLEKSNKIFIENRCLVYLITAP